MYITSTVKEKVKHSTTVAPVVALKYEKYKHKNIGFNTLPFADLMI